MNDQVRIKDLLKALEGLDPELPVFVSDKTYDSPIYISGVYAEEGERGFVDIEVSVDIYTGGSEE
jgi:hypothetical protein